MDFDAMINSRRVQLLVVAVVISLFLVFLRNGYPPQLSSNLGIEFVGGVRIPVMLQQSVDANTMASMVDTIKLRINKLGLAQANVQSVGSTEILVEIPQAGPDAISNVESILRQQGRFEAIIDGAQALNGSDIIPSSVGGPNNEAVTQSQTGYNWQLGFAATASGAQKFADAANGKAHFPVDMFLDRPQNAAILLDQSWYNSTSSIQLTTQALQNAAHKRGDDIQIIWLDSWNNNSISLLSNVSTVIVADSSIQSRPYVYNALVKAGFVNATGNTTIGPLVKGLIIVRPQADLTATIYTDAQRIVTVDKWPAIGLLSGPELDPGLASGYVSQFYQISGTTTGNTPALAQANAIQQIKDLESVISSGRLPVSTYVGSSYSVAPSLGRQFLAYSIYGLLLAIVVVGLLIVLRYRNLTLLVPIMVVDLCEVLITLAIVGTIGTVSLATAAGIITIIGTAVDNQIIITDELLAKKEGRHHEEENKDESFQQKIGRAFHIIFTTAAIAIVAMLPLLLSGIVEISGFALSTIIGIIVGVLITRPAFGEIVEDMIK